MFKKSNYSMKSSLCRRLAKQIAGVLTRAGVIEVQIENSKQSASTYVSFGIDIDPEYGALDSVKIRVSDHADRYGSDYHIWASDADDKVWLEKTSQILAKYYPELSLSKRDANALLKSQAV